MMFSHYNRQGVPLGCHTKLIFLTFPLCPALWLLEWLSWQWHMYAFIMMLVVIDYFNKGYLLIILFELLVGEVVWNFVWLVIFIIPFHALAVFMHFFLLFFDDDDFGANIFSNHQKIFSILESISYLVSNLTLKYFQFLWTNNSVNPHPSCSDICFCYR